MCSSTHALQLPASLPGCSTEGQRVPLNVRGLQGQGWGQHRAGMAHHWPHSPDVTHSRQLLPPSQQKAVDSAEVIWGHTVAPPMATLGSLLSPLDCSVLSSLLPS